MCAVCAERFIGLEIILDALNELSEWVVWNLISVRLETVFVSVQYRSMVCAERTIGSEMVLDAPDGTPR
jgi:uncharacterized membrane protein